MKKILLLIIGLTFIFTANLAVAADDPKENDILKQCKDKLPEYETIDLEEPYEGQYNLNFRLAFEKARTDYHNYVKCIFDRAAIDMLASASGDTEGVGLAVLIDKLPDLLKPKTACKKEKDLTKIMSDGSPKSLLKPLLETYNKYVGHLKALLVEISKNLEVPEESAQDFSLLITRKQAFQLIIENEIQDAYVALDAAFITLKEMRQAFVMHVHFQCILQNLEAYRRVMENLRVVVESLPGVIEDCSMHK